MGAMGRDTSLDMLKVLGTMAVVVLHVSMGWVVHVDVDSLSWWLANMSNAWSRFGTPIFVMVAGAVLLGRPSEKAPLSFVLARWSRLAPAVIFWSIFYLAWRRFAGTSLTWKDMLGDLALGVPSYHLWFMYMMLGLYPLVPAIRLVVRSNDDRATQYFCLAVSAAMTCLVALYEVVLHHTYGGFLGLSPLFIVYLMGGYLLYRDRPRVPAWLLIALPLASIICMAVGSALLYPHVSEQAFTLMYSDRSPWAMLMTFSFFVAAVRMSVGFALPKICHVLAPVTLGIYAVHPFWIDMLGRSGWVLRDFGKWWLVPAIVVYGLSAATALIMKQIPGLRRTVM